ncbi:MAG: sulfotransferase family 2 domain-containing protein [Pseudomonadota bacterium]
MIISNARKAAFIHIPKCGGTTARSFLSSLQDIEDWEGVYDHPDLGEVFPAHLTLFQLQKYYPSTLERLDSYETFAFVRDPRARFVSSLAEHIRKYHGGMYEMTTRQLQRKAGRICELLSNHDSNLPLHLAHFQPQSRYVFLHGRRFVKTIFLLSDYAAIATYTHRTFGSALHMEEQKQNQTITYRNNLVAECLVLLRRSVRGFGLVPDFMKAPFRKVLYREASLEWRENVISGSVEAFIEDYYQEDIRLFEGIKSARGCVDAI